MSKFWKDIEKSAKHTLEFVGVFTAGYLILRFLPGVDGPAQQLVISTVLAFFVKFARASDKIPLPDYVNSDANK